MSKPKGADPSRRKVTTHKAGKSRGPFKPNTSRNTYSLTVNENPTHPDYLHHTYKDRRTAKAVARSLVANGKAATVRVTTSAAGGSGSVFDTGNVKAWPKYRPGKVRSVTRSK